MVLTGVWTAGSNVTEPISHQHLRTCVYVWYHILASRRGFTQYWPCQLEVLCSLSAQRATIGVQALSACDGTQTSSREEINRVVHLQTEVNFTSATLKIDDDGPRFSGSKKQEALRDSLHLSKLWRME